MLPLCLETAKGRGPTKKFVPGPLAALGAPGSNTGSAKIQYLNKTLEKNNNVKMKRTNPLSNAGLKTRWHSYSSSRSLKIRENFFIFSIASSVIFTDFMLSLSSFYRV